ncbi:pentapeptide repeat-containing protein [Roseiconus lacunae]|uniref:pentapeptide repeat-containing protein n=1 Tax=Roseiconus lacunae TaxID=2605694 RepID=UPI0011F38918|nr:pentapeptide repeat-containing protein [Roseiconus lacunae]
MSLSQGLVTIADWVTTFAGASGDAIGFSLPEGFLSDTYLEICERAEVAGSVFKLGGMALNLAPEADPETKIAAKLSEALISTLNFELANQSEDEPYRFITKETWQKYQAKELNNTAMAVLSSQFTWLTVIGKHGRLSSRNWPIICEYANFARRIVVDAIAYENATISREAIQFSNQVRGSVFSSLCDAIEELMTTPAMMEAFRLNTAIAERSKLILLNEVYSTLNESLLFDEVRQSDIYISPRVRVKDYSRSELEEDWNNIKPSANGDSLLLKKVTESAGRSQIFVVEGEMGAGKSCLLRNLASALAKQFLEDQTQAVVFAKWRSIYNSNNLIDGIANSVASEFGIELQDLKDSRNLVLIVDGFDEMRSHAEHVVESYFNSLVNLSKSHESPLIVAMRSTVGSESLKRNWKDNRVHVMKVSQFTDQDTDQWAEKWNTIQKSPEVTGELIRHVCSGLKDVSNNPLLLFMLAKFVLAEIHRNEGRLSRAEIFRIFVDETIAGKASLSGERAGIDVKTQHYRHLLQEIAWICSWPKFGGRCPLRELRNTIENNRNNNLKEDLGIEDARTAFVLQFFEPAENSEEFEFHPESFRHYLLAEWCVRTQCEAAICIDDPPNYPLGRTRDDARNALAQIPVREIEREFIDELYEQAPVLLTSDDETTVKSIQNTFGLKDSSSVGAVFRQATRESNVPPRIDWQRKDVGVPDGHLDEQAFERLRLMVNHWDQSLLAATGLARSQKAWNKNASQNVLNLHPLSLNRHLAAQRITRSGWSVDFYNLSGLVLNDLELRQATLSDTQGYRTDFRDVHFFGVYFDDVFFAYSRWNKFSMFLCHIYGTHLGHAFLKEGGFSECNFASSVFARSTLHGIRFSDCNFYGTRMDGTNLEWCNFSACDFEDSIFTRAKLTNSNLTACRFKNDKLDFSELNNVSFDNCEFSDIDLSRTELNQLSFADCKIGSVQMLKSQRNSVEFEGLNPGKIKLG